MTKAPNDEVGKARHGRIIDAEACSRGVSLISLPGLISAFPRGARTGRSTPIPRAATKHMRAAPTGRRDQARGWPRFRQARACSFGLGVRAAGHPARRPRPFRPNGPAEQSRRGPISFCDAHDRPAPTSSATSPVTPPPYYPRPRPRPPRNRPRPPPKPTADPDQDTHSPTAGPAFASACRRARLHSAGPAGPKTYAIWVWPSGGTANGITGHGRRQRSAGAPHAPVLGLPGVAPRSHLPRWEASPTARADELLATVTVGPTTRQKRAQAASPLTANRLKATAAQAHQYPPPRPAP